MNLHDKSTSMLYRLRDRITAEIERREAGEIPEELRCGHCRREIEGDSYQYDENAYACDFCYKTDEQIREWVETYRSFTQ